MDISFAGRRILITGAGRGIGKELALHLSKDNATVIALSKTKENLDALKKQDPRIQTICVDLQNWNETREAVKNILPIDLLVNNAAVVHLNSFFEATENDIDNSFDINLKSIVNVSQVVISNMIERKIAGSIVNVSSVCSHVAVKNHAVYSASKAALDMLTKVMALEFGPHKIRVNTVNPTVVWTERGKLHWGESTKVKEVLDKIPLGRFAEIREVIDTILFLLSDRSSMTTGASLPIDGGYLSV